jgi:recombination protein RecT
MNNQIATQNEPRNAVAVFREDLQKMAPQFAFALPAHIPVERFLRVVMTAVQNQPKLMRCSKQSVLNACMKCAQDGLLPDGREAALVPFSEDEDGRGKSDQAQYLPMIAGIRKKVRNAHVLTDWNVQVVQQGDEFDFALGDNPFIAHKPAARGGRDRPVLFAYSIATFPDGTKSREVMNIDQIRDIQKKSKAKRGPWSDPVFFPEMCRKTVAKLHAKQLPQSTDLDTLLRRDDDLYDFKDAKERGKAAPRPASVQAALDQFGAAPPSAPVADDVPETLPDDPEQAEAEADAMAEAARGSTAGTGPAPQTTTPASPAPSDTAERRGSEPAAASPPSTLGGGGQLDPIRVAYERGQEAKAKGALRRAMPGEYRGAENSKLAVAWDRGWSGEPLD